MNTSTCFSHTQTHNCTQPNLSASPADLLKALMRMHCMNILSSTETQPNQGITTIYSMHIDRELY